MKALIVDDEPMPAKHLQNLVEKHCSEITQTRVLNSPIEALEHLKEHHFDLLFLDVEMPELTGFELLEEANLTPSTQVIFTTAYSQYAVEAFQSKEVHYMLKIVSKDELVAAVRKATQMLRQNQSLD